MLKALAIISTMSKIIIFSEPKKLPKVKQRKTVARLWPKIAEDIASRPNIPLKERFKYFKDELVSMTVMTFVRNCKKLGANKLQSQNLVRTNKESEEVAMSITDSFVAARAHHGNNHLARMHNVIKNAHDVIDKQSKAARKTPELLGEHLDCANKLQKLAVSVYGIREEEEAKPNQMNVLVLSGYQTPQFASAEKPTKGRVVQES